MNNWKPVERELESRDEASAPACLWLRDDDAIEATGQLEQLLELTGQFAVPVTLAVIPQSATDALAQQLAPHRDVSVALHGFSHINYAPAGQKKCELGRHRPRQVVLAELVAGRKKLVQMFGPRFIHMLVPPWNRIDQLLVPELVGIDLTRLSTFGWNKFPAIAGLAQHNTHVDMIDWKGNGGGRSVRDLVGELATALHTTRHTAHHRTRHRGGDAAVGILSHHLVHDAAAWEFLRQLFRFCQGRTDIEWRQAASLSNDAVL